MSEYYKLKSISVDAIEGAIAKALSELTGFSTIAGFQT